jgi:hypothetical protein
VLDPAGPATGAGARAVPRVATVVRVAADRPFATAWAAARSRAEAATAGPR